MTMESYCPFFKSNVKPPATWPGQLSCSLAASFFFLEKELAPYFKYLSRSGCSFREWCQSNFQKRKGLWQAIHSPEIKFGILISAYLFTTTGRYSPVVPVFFKSCSRAGITYYVKFPNGTITISIEMNEASLERLELVLSANPSGSFQDNFEVIEMALDCLLVALPHIF
ncbi:MAG: hypothetical protein H6581_19955 [Bacteroidia bacterium]|nr:hypothetical protein [Bacteroidia bacterium]